MISERNRPCANRDSSREPVHPEGGPGEGPPRGRTRLGRSEKGEGEMSVKSDPVRFFNDYYVLNNGTVNLMRHSWRGG